LGPLRGYFTVNDVVKKLKKFKISKRNLQYLDKTGKVKAMRDHLSNYRVYSEQDIEKIEKLIKGFK